MKISEKDCVSRANSDPLSLETEENGRNRPSKGLWAPGLVEKVAINVHAPLTSPWHTLLLSPPS